MTTEISNLIEVSRFYGGQKDYTLGGGGNTSFKNKDLIYIKASGHSLASITEAGFAVLNRAGLSAMINKKYSDDPNTRENEVKEDLLAARKDPNSTLRPSVETSLHDAIHYSYVVHMHPHMINGLLCSRNAEKITGELFGDKGLFVPYTDPGLILFKKVLSMLEEYRKSHSSDPSYLFLQNHGVFVSADTVDEIHDLYRYIDSQLMRKIQKRLTVSERKLHSDAEKDLDLLQEFLKGKKTMGFRYNSLIEGFTQSRSMLDKIAKPFIPDQIVYCKALPLMITRSKAHPLSPEDLSILFEEYLERHGFEPKVVLIEGGALAGIEDSEKSVNLVLDMFEDAMRISYYSEFFGGPNFMSDDQIAFIENWEVEHYRQKVAKGENP